MINQDSVAVDVREAIAKSRCIHEERRIAELASGYTGELSKRDATITRIAACLVEQTDCIEGLLWQFGIRGMEDGKRMLWAGGLSALEDAFEVLGWDDPHFVEDQGCEHPGCVKWATCGTPTPDGYKRLCGEHFAAIDAAEVLRIQREGRQ